MPYQKGVYLVRGIGAWSGGDRCLVRGGVWSRLYLAKGYGMVMPPSDQTLF